jgi:hypothetical protein
VFDTLRSVNRSHTRSSLRRLFFSSVAMAFVFLLACWREAPAVPDKRPVPTSFVRGVGLGLFASDPDYDYSALLREIASHGATDVLIAVSWYQDDIRAHEIAPRTGFSPSTQTIARTLDQARALGLRAALLPIVRLTHRTREEWRGRIVPDAGVDVWFTHYRAYIMQMAELAEKHGVARFSVGSELLSMERHDAHWRALIDDVRGAYKGKLLYSANWDHFDPIRFWDALDEVGVTAYFELTTDDERPPVDDLVMAWTRPRIELMRLKREVQKPLIITEIGYPSRTTAARAPWDETRASPLDLTLQRDLYDAFCRAFRGQGVLDGVYFWNWFGFGGPTDTTYTPRAKPAAEVMRTCLTDARWDATAPTVPTPVVGEHAQPGR